MQTVVLLPCSLLVKALCNNWQSLRQESLALPAGLRKTFSLTYFVGLFMLNVDSSLVDGFLYEDYCSTLSL